ncbi:unnamed protein product [Zymoseptoria tritici ST99CH_3D1]|nr:unnamed protein product [Zymoseptoria tritici ST99CH_3D1]
MQLLALISTVLMVLGLAAADCSRPYYYSVQGKCQLYNCERVLPRSLLDPGDKWRLMQWYSSLIEGLTRPRGLPTRRSVECRWLAMAGKHHQAYA